MDASQLVQLLDSTLPNWVTTSFPILRVIFIAVIALAAIGIIIFVFLQEANSSGLNSLTGGNEDSFFTQNKGMSKKVRRKRWTYALAITIFVVTILYFISFAIYPAA